MSIDFGRLASDLLAQAESLVPSWLPEGKRQGREWVVGSVRGEAGESLKINLDKGIWHEFAAGEGGKDLISLYAAIHGMKQGDAAKELGADVTTDAPPPPKRKPAVIDAPAERPPEDAGEPPPHYKLGAPVATYPYCDREGLIGYVCRYEPKDGRKQFAPWRWVSGKWVAKALPKPRPLYRTPGLMERPDAMVLVVEGEKAADAAQDMLTQYAVTTWSGGASSCETADWSLLAGRKVALWPDNDAPGREAMGALAILLHKLGCQIRTINPADQPEGWDAADAAAEGWNAKKFMAWVKRDDGKYLVPFQLPAPEPVAPATPDPAVSPSFSADLPAQVQGTEPIAFADLADRQLWEIYGFETRIGNGTPPANEDTVDRALRFRPGQFWYDEFLQRGMTTWGDTPPRPIHDADYGKVLLWMQRDLRLHKMKPGTVRNGIETYLFQHRRNCAQDWLRGLKWDGVKRLQCLLPIGFGTPDDEYHQKVGRNFIMGMVHRVLEPGCQVDNLPIFEGGQGAGKSTALRIIGGDWFTEAHEAMTGKDFLQILPGKMLLEISELNSMRRADAERIKGIISNRVDTYRASYGRTAGDYPRMCVFAGTTNRDDWNQDDTGARRFWRVRTGAVSLDWLREWREPLLAEAVRYVLAGEEHYRVPQTVARQLQDEAMSDDPWHGPVLRYAEARHPVRAEDVLRDVLQIPLDRQDKPALGRVRSILRREGWVSCSVRSGKSVHRAWRPSSIADDTDSPPPRPAADTTDFDGDEPALSN